MARSLEPISTTVYASIKEKRENRTKEELHFTNPKLFKVIILNDHYTTVDFVIDILLHIFNKDYQEALTLTYEVHQKGAGVCGEYPYDIAMTKIKECEQEARQNGFPLKLICEEI